MKPSSLIAVFNRWALWRRQVSVWDFRLRAPTFDRWLYLRMHRLGRMGGEEKTYLAQVLRPGLHIADIGANIGLYTLLLSRLVGPTGRIYAFEPDPLMAGALRENLAANTATQVEVFPCAIGATPGEAVLQRNAVNSGDNRLGRTTGTALHSEAAVVAVRSLDDALGDRRLDFIKMDVQGWEGEAFQGFAGVLDANPGLRIYFEFWPHGLRRAGTDIPRLAEILRSLRLVACDPVTGQPVDLAAVARTLPGKAFTNLIAHRA